MGCCWSQEDSRSVVDVPSAQSDGTPSEERETTGHVVRTSKMEVDCLSGYTSVNQYLLIKNLGKGSFGKVKLALSMEDNSLRAVKVVSKKLMRRRHLGGRGEQQAETDFHREINVMKSLQHPNVVRLHEVIDDPSDDKLLMVMEFVDGGEVMSAHQIGPNKPGLSEPLARRHFRHLVKGLEYLHCQNIIHRDIKPENLLLTHDGVLKLSDFGSAAYFPDGNDMITDSVGTRMFFAPEACQDGKPYSGKKADVYAAGVVLYMMTFAREPFEFETDYDLLQKIRNEEPDFSLRPDASPALITLIKNLMCKDPEERMTLEETMTDPWFTNQARLSSIRSSRYMSFPKVESNATSDDEAVTPSIAAFFKKIPKKHKRRFKAGDYLVREGEELTGLYWIEKGYCEATSSEWEHEEESAVLSNDEDFEEEENENEKQIPREASLLKAISTSPQTAEAMADEAAGIARFTSLQQDEIIKGVGRRPTNKHKQWKEAVETAYQDKRARTYKAFVIAPNGKRRGPGTLIGGDLADIAAKSKQSVCALEPVLTTFVERSVLEEALSQPDSQLQLRLLISRLQRAFVMTDVVEKLADLHPDIVQLGSLREEFRRQSKRGILFTNNPPVIAE